MSVCKAIIITQYISESRVLYRISTEDLVPVCLISLYFAASYLDFSGCRLGPDIHGNQIPVQCWTNSDNLKIWIWLFWDVAPCSLVEGKVSKVLTDFFIMLMKTVSTSETSVNLYHSTRRSIPEDSCLHARRRENLIPHYIKTWLYF
jgi:hypothetical protein